MSQADRIILRMGHRWTADTQVRNALPRGSEADNRLIDCALIDGIGRGGKRGVVDETRKEEEEHAQGANERESEGTAVGRGRDVRPKDSDISENSPFLLLISKPYYLWIIDEQKVETLEMDSRVDPEKPSHVVSTDDGCKNCLTTKEDEPSQLSCQTQLHE
ncbi:hypothetical protein WH47_03020 [Habropoda laboriosa]|uniref:Uncharacterized protein n=1 Tax=Habropoda laboriosa TaxID=597456 RepID=A0A0L7QSY4_9HYME|nr:hypothetical protein WH47_03020 [Habropoda laboriosa]